MQWSPDLVHWQYLPMMKADVGPHSYDGAANVAEKYFIRLRSTALDPALDSFDTDTLSNWDEVTIYFTDPFHPDTDRDGMPDDFEVAHQLDPNNPADADADPDQDGLTNAEEMELATNPQVADTDGDGVSDGEENVAGTSPLDPASCLTTRQAL